MKNIHKEIDSYLRLAEIAKTILSLSSHQYVSTEKTAHAKDFYEAAAKKAFGIARYIKNTSPTRFELDPSCLATLSRSLMEACELFYYHYVDVVPKEEWQFRQALWVVHESQEEDAIKQLLDLKNVTTFYNFDGLAGKYAKTDLENNKFFLRLKNKVRNELLTGKRANDKRNSPYRALPFGISKNERDGIYKLLSNCAHSTGYNRVIASTKVTTTIDPVYIINVSLLCSIHFLAYTTNEYVKRRWRISKELTVSDKEFIHQMLKPDFMNIVKKIQIKRLEEMNPFFHITNLD